MSNASILGLIRPEIRDLAAYRAADYVAGLVRLNANETPWRPIGDTTADGLNRYPDPRPVALGARLAAHYGVRQSQLLVTRGSSEAIDVLLRAFCRAGTDSIVICPPTFGMYEVYARIQGAQVIAQPLLADRDFALPVTEILAGWTPTTKLVFVCSPNNPTGNCFADADVDRLCTSLENRGVVVIDAAYAEFAPHDRTAELLSRFDNVVVLRTLSKALGLAGVRCGVLLGPDAIVEVVSRTLPPYCFPTVSQEAVLRALQPAAVDDMAARRALIQSERSRLATALTRLPSIRRVWPSDANFILVESSDAADLVARARAGGVLIRDFSWDRWLPGCVRITVGTPDENDRLIHSLTP